jgi:hypothetical protein
MKITYSFFLAVYILLISCTGEKSSNENSKQNIEPSQSDSLQNAEVPKNTKIEFYETIHDFGKINEGEKVQHKFKFKNVGNAPLIIQRTSTSCGCTVPTHTKDPVPPGGEGEINVEYNSKDREGQIEKSVIVFANTDPPTTKLKIKVFVLKKITGPYNN